MPRRTALAATLLSAACSTAPFAARAVIRSDAGPEDATMADGRVEASGVDAPVAEDVGASVDAAGEAEAGADASVGDVVGADAAVDAYESEPAPICCQVLDPFGNSLGAPACSDRSPPNGRGGWLCAYPGGQCENDAADCGCNAGCPYDASCLPYAAGTNGFVTDCRPWVKD